MTFPNEVISGVPNELGALYIGALYCVCNQSEVFNKNIRSIINTSHDVTAFHAYQTSVRRLKENLHVTFARLMWKDSDDQTLTEADLEAVIKHIHAQRLARKGVLVHCVMGKSRSAALVAAYLCALKKDKSVEECLEVVKGAREQAEPRESFVVQLKALHEKGFFKALELPTKT